MGDIKCIDLTGLPSTREGFYATNNQFQKSGPKGSIQVKVLDNDKLYVRVDLPGVPDDAILHRIDSVRQKVVIFFGETLDGVNEKEGVREYSGTTGLGCDCCEKTNVEAKMKDGVLRMILTRVKVKDPENKCSDLTLPPFTGKSGIHLEDHPFVVKTRKRAFVGKPTAGGGFHFTADVPGACGDDIQVYVVKDEVRFYAETKNVHEHDDGGRIYLGSIEFPAILSYTITWTAQFGVFKLFLAPPPPSVNNNNNEA